MKTIYAIPNFECNLSCNHCDIHKIQCTYDEKLFLQQLKSFDVNDNIILFGGEPTLYANRLNAILQNVNVNSMSTNLLNLNDQILKLIDDNPNIAISTSWNRNRFTNKQYITWLSNLKVISHINRKCMLLITMTDDLIADNFFDQFLSILHEIDETTAIDKVLFEHYVGEYATEQYNDKCDDWLCKIHNCWNYSFSNMIEQKVLNWKYFCNDVYTLYPNGLLKKHCPHALQQHFLEKCLACKYSAICKPCKLQKSCSFPKKLYLLVK